MLRRRGYAIKNWNGRRWLQTRTSVENVPCPVTVWVLDMGEAWVFSRLSDARRMLALVRADSRRPEAIHVVDRKGRVVV